MRVTKQTVLELIAGMPDGKQRQAVIAKMIREGDLTDTDIAEMSEYEIIHYSAKYQKIFKEDETVQRIYERYKDTPEVLARILVKLYPDVFLSEGFAKRLIVRIRATLGTYFVPPQRSGTGSGWDLDPIPNLNELIAKDLLEFDVQHVMKALMFVYSHDAAFARQALDEDARGARGYKQHVLEVARERFESLLSASYPNVVTEIVDEEGKHHLFPALHVRSWIQLGQPIERVLNIGETCTYKTSHALVASQAYGLRRVLVICSANARQNYEREAHRYFVDTAHRVQTMKSLSEADAFLERCSVTQFNVLAWSTLSLSRKNHFLERLLQIPFDGLIIDEIQNGKGGVNEETAPERAKALLALSRSLVGVKRVFAASATPWENKPSEMAATCAILRPDLFSDPKRFLTSGLKEVPRLLREVLDSNVLDIAFRDVRDSTKVHPKPWEELFNSTAVHMNNVQRKLYEKLLWDDSEDRVASKKMRLLLQLTVHPPLLHTESLWTAEERTELLDWNNNAKLKWLKRQIDSRINTQKIVVGTGVSVTGITRPMEDASLPWVGEILKRWYGDESVVIIDGEVAIGTDRNKQIDRWRSNPHAKILLVSMSAVPDSINLSVRPLREIEGVFITALQLDWKPWYQFLNRFTRESAGAPVEYQLPILEETIDDALLRLLQDKWRIQQLFRAKVPLTDEEWNVLKADESGSAVREMLRTPEEHAHEIYSRARGLGENGLAALFQEQSGLHSKGRAFAETFFKIQENKLSGSIARFMRKTLRAYVESNCPPDRILDAGCGSLMLARTLDYPICGVDLNEHMVNLARRELPELAARTQLGLLTDMPRDWTGRFRITVCSLVLDWSSLLQRADGVPERLAILRELVRVTHPQGLIWLTFPQAVLSDALYLKWREVLLSNGFVLADGNNGLVMSVDGPKGGAHQFWSLLFSPNGNRLAKVEPCSLSLLFETGQGHTKVHSEHEQSTEVSPKAFRHETFSVNSLDRSQQVLTDELAAAQALIGELVRMRELVASGNDAEFTMRLSAEFLGQFKSNWKILAKLQRLGIISI